MKIYKHYNDKFQNVLYNGNCQKFFRELPDESVDLIITSPPYCMGSIRKSY